MVLEIKSFYLYLSYGIFMINVSSCNQVFQVTTTFIMVDIQKAAGDGDEFLKVRSSLSTMKTLISHSLSKEQALRKP